MPLDGLGEAQIRTSAIPWSSLSESLIISDGIFSASALLLANIFCRGL